MKKTLLAFSLAAALTGTLKSDEKKTPEAIFSKVPLHRLDGKEFKEAELKKSPEYYIFYFSASW